MAMAEIVVAASTIVMAKAEIVVGAFTIVMVKAEIVSVVLPFGRDWGDSRISANFSWPEGLPNYLTQRPAVGGDGELGRGVVADPVAVAGIGPGTSSTRCYRNERG